MPLAIAAAWGAPHSLAGSGRSRIAIEHNLAELAPIGPLSDWLDAHVPELDTGPLQTAILSGGTSNVVLTLDRGDRKMVLRRPPTIPPPGAEKGVLREARILTALNATAVPDTGNAEILALFGTEAQKAQHLGPPAWRARSCRVFR